MKKIDLINKLNNKTSFPYKDVKLATDYILDSLIGAISNNERVEIRGFGSFSRKERKEHLGINPKTGERIAINKRFAVFFKPGKPLKDAVNLNNK